MKINIQKLCINICIKHLKMLQDPNKRLQLRTFRWENVTKYAFCCFLNDRQGALDDFLSNQHTIKV